MGPGPQDKNHKAPYGRVSSPVWGWMNFVQNSLGTVHIDGLVQDRSNSIANALELQQSSTKPSI